VRVGRTPDRLSAEERDVGGPETSRRVGIADERRRQLAACGAPEKATLDDRGTEPEEDRLVDEDL
jgi:hypothetical protein